MPGFLGIDEALLGVWLFVVQVCVLLGVGRGLSGSLWVLLCWGCSGVISRHAFASCAGNRYGFVWPGVPRMTQAARPVWFGV